jgi:hypothetical protein
MVDNDWRQSSRVASTGTAHAQRRVMTELRLVKVQFHQFLATPGPCFKRLTTIAADKAEPLVQLPSFVISVKDPEEDGSNAGALQTIENRVNHVEGDAAAAEFWHYPEIFQKALTGERLGLTRNTDQTYRLIRWLPVSDTNVPVAAAELRTPVGLIKFLFAFIRRQEIPWRLTQCGYPNITQYMPFIRRKHPDVKHKAPF